LAHNCIEDISLVQPLRRLRILRLSENKLLTFNADSFPGLRTLYLDDNRLQSLENCQTLTRLENFSARDQEGEGIAIDMTEFINSRKLYLSGNPIHALDFNMGFYRLEYLEICAGCLSELPIDFATLFPNLRGLNLSYNGLDSLAALDGLHRLRRLIFVGNSLKSFSDVLSLVKRMRSLVTLDLR
jgi:Leucine-rich repeat (LRR) protein